MKSKKQKQLEANDRKIQRVARGDFEQLVLIRRRCGHLEGKEAQRLLKGISSDDLAKLSQIH